MDRALIRPGEPETYVPFQVSWYCSHPTYLIQRSRRNRSIGEFAFPLILLLRGHDLGLKKGGPRLWVPLLLQRVNQVRSVRSQSKRARNCRSRRCLWSTATEQVIEIHGGSLPRRDAFTLYLSGSDHFVQPDRSCRGAGDATSCR